MINTYYYLDLPSSPINYPSPPNVAIVGGGNTYPTLSPPGYTVQSVTINEGVSLTITLSMNVKRSGIFSNPNDYFPIAGGGTLTFRLYKNSNYFLAIFSLLLLVKFIFSLYKLYS